MRKWLYLVSVIIIAGVLSAAYYYTGVRAEKEFKTLLASVSHLPNLKLSAENYQRGWLKSTVRMHVVLHQSPQSYEQSGMLQTLPAQDISFSFDLDIYHGPIIFVNHRMIFGLGYARTAVPLPDEMLNQFSQVFTSNSTKPNFIISLLLHYNEKMNVDLDVQPFILTSKNGLAQINWQGFEGHWDVSRKLSHIQGSVAFHGMTFKMNGTTGSIGSVGLKYNVANKNDSVLSGNASVRLKTLQVTEGNQLPLNLEGFQAVSQSKIQNQDNVQLIDSSLRADVANVTFQGLDYGPGVLNLNLSHLDAEALADIQKKFQATSNSNMTSTEQQIFLLTLLPEFARLLDKGAELDVKQFQMALPEGLILGTAKITFPNQSNSSQNPLQLIQQMIAQVKAEVPVSWLNARLTDFLQLKIQQRQLMESQQKTNNELTTSSEEAKPLSIQEINVLAKQQASEQLANLVQNGVLIQNENVYQIKINFQGGVLFVNGKPFNSKQISEGGNNDSTH